MSAAERLEVLRGIRYRESGLAGKVIHASLPLRQELEQLEAVRAANRLPDPGELLVEAVLKQSVVVHAFPRRGGACSSQDSGRDR